jgi:hypothetical protein
MNTSRVRVGTRTQWLRRARLWLTGAAVAVACSPVYAQPTTVGAGSLGSQDIRDIRPPFHFSQEWPWLLGILAWCLLAVLVDALWSWWRRRVLARRRSAHEVALARLRAAQSLMLPEQARAFSIAVSGIIRAYIEARFEIRAAHHTTPEFLRDCVTEADGLLAPHRQILELFLRHCDLAKFARWVLSVAEMQDMLASAVDFVIETAQISPLASGRPADASGQGGPRSAPEATAP